MLIWRVAIRLHQADDARKASARACAIFREMIAASNVNMDPHRQPPIILCDFGSSCGSGRRGIARQREAIRSSPGYRSRLRRWQMHAVSLQRAKIWSKCRPELARQFLGRAVPRRILRRTLLRDTLQVTAEQSH